MPTGPVASPFLVHWREALARPGFVRALVVLLALAAVEVLVLPRFFGWLGQRPGFRPADPLLPLWEPVDVSVATFLVLYGSLVLVLRAIAHRPYVVLRGVAAYVVLVLLRMLAMALVALEPPPLIIPLVDPVSQAFYPGAAPFLKDLFFSGHTATMVLLVLLAPPGPVRWWAVAGTVAVATLVLVQHVHWTVDVLAAMPAAWMAWALAGRMLARTIGMSGA